MGFEPTVTVLQTDAPTCRFKVLRLSQGSLQGTSVATRWDGVPCRAARCPGGARAAASCPIQPAREHVPVCAIRSAVRARVPRIEIAAHPGLCGSAAGRVIVPSVTRAAIAFLDVPEMIAPLPAARAHDGGREDVVGHHRARHARAAIIITAWACI